MRRCLTALAALVAACSLATVASASHGPAELVSAGSTGGNGPLSAVYAGSSVDGEQVFFETLERLTADDTDTRNDVYERANGVTTRVSTGSTGGNGGIDAFFYAASADGAVVLFGTSERLVAADTDSASDVYARANGTTTLVSTGSTGGNGPQGAFFDGAATDGSRVFFHTIERLTADDTDSQVDVYERAAGATVLVSSGSTGGNGAFGAFFDGASADGTHVFFDTDEQLTGGDSDSVQDVYERQAGSTSLVSTGPDGGNREFPAFFDGNSEDGTRVMLSSEEILAEPDGDAQWDVYQRDGGTMEVVSATADTGSDAFDAIYAGATPDGLHVYFQTEEPMVAADSDAQVDVYERAGAAITRSSAGNGAFDALFGGASDAGSHVFWETDEPVVASDTDTAVDVYDSSGSTVLASTGPAGGNAELDASFADVSADGARAFFTTPESLVAGDTDASTDVYERAAGTTSLISTGSAGGNGAFNASFAAASTDGATAIFTTTERLAAGDTDSVADVYAARARGGYPRPKGASPLRVSLVPAFEPCTAPNRTHGPPLAFASCAPPQQSSSDLTVGTPDANGQPAASIGYLRLATVAGNPATPIDEADMSVTASISDVREAGTLADYLGELTATLSVRLTDRDGPATVEDFPFDVGIPCVDTPTAEGATCSVATSFEALVPGAVTEGRRSIWQFDAVEVKDGSGNTFARQGIFVP